MGRIKHSEQVYINDNIGCEVKLANIMGLYDESRYLMAAIVGIWANPARGSTGHKHVVYMCGSNFL